MERTEREMKFLSKVDLLKDMAKEITAEFIEFTTGVRVLILLERKKDGGSNMEEKRMFESYTTTNPAEFEEKLFNLLLIKASNPTHKLRIYLSANPRDIKKVIRYVENQLVDAHYSSEEQQQSIYKKLLKKPRHFLMQPQNKESSLFLIDIDNETGEDEMGIALQRMAELGVEEVKRYKTKAGWHIVVKPFDLSKWNSVGEVKKDPLILLAH